MASLLLSHRLVMIQTDVQLFVSGLISCVNGITACLSLIDLLWYKLTSLWDRVKMMRPDTNNCISVCIITSLWDRRRDAIYTTDETWYKQLYICLYHNKSMRQSQAGMPFTQQLCKWHPRLTLSHRLVMIQTDVQLFVSGLISCVNGIPTWLCLIDLLWYKQMYNCLYQVSSSWLSVV
jgi:hypothetical protein